MQTMAQTLFGNVIVFLEQIGVYDVVLPFIMVFTIMFAILEKTRVFGTEKVKGELFPKKNINSLVAFCVAFFVVASSQLVEVILNVSARVVILLLLSVFFLLLIGSFHAEGPISLEGEEKKGWRTGLITIMFIGVVLIFLYTLKLPSGISWLEFGLYWLERNISSGAVASVLTLLGLAFFMFYITQPGHIGEGAKKPEEKKK